MSVRETAMAGTVPLGRGRRLAPGSSDPGAASDARAGSPKVGGMPQLRLALAQVNAVVGDFAGNARMVRDWVARAADVGADLVAFPEMVLTGYPVEDLVLSVWYREGA